MTTQARGEIVRGTVALAALVAWCAVVLLVAG